METHFLWLFAQAWKGAGLVQTRTWNAEECGKVRLHVSVLRFANA